MNEFIEEFEKDLHQRFNSENLSKEEVLCLEKGNLPRDQYFKKKLTRRQYQMVTKDVYLNKVKDQLNIIDY